MVAVYKRIFQGELNVILGVGFHFLKVCWVVEGVLAKIFILWLDFCLMPLSS